MPRRVIMLSAALLLAGLATPSAMSAPSEEDQFNVVVGLYNSGQWQAAIQQIEKREKHNLSDTMAARYMYVRGLAYEMGGKTAQAHAAYTTLITQSIWPSAAKARVALVYLDYAKGDNNRVLSAYTKIDLKSLDAASRRDLTLMYAESLMAESDLKRAASAFETALSYGADRNLVAPKLFDLYMRVDDHGNVIAITNHGVAGADPAFVALARAEAFLAVGKSEDAEREAAKVPRAHAHYPRACYARARALVARGRFKDAISPLHVAAKRMDNPQARFAAALALVECLLEDKQTQAADTDLLAARKNVAALSKNDRTQFRGQLAMLGLRVAAASNDRKRIIKEVAAARDVVPDKQLARVLYMRLYALSQDNDTAGILATMNADHPVLKKSAQDGAATWIYYHALKKAKRYDEGMALLDDLVNRSPKSSDVLHARLELANTHLGRNAYEKAGPYLSTIMASRNAKAVLGARPYHEVLCNRGVVALKSDDMDTAIRSFQAVIDEKPAKDLLGTALQLLGQAYLEKQDYQNAAATWNSALEQQLIADGGALRVRLAKVKFLSKDYPGASTQLAALARLTGGDEKLDKTALELWARSLYAQKQFADSAAKYQLLHERYGLTTAQAYEYAVTLEMADRVVDAAKWYESAMKDIKKLPADYAAVVAANAAAARFKSKTGDMGRIFWLTHLASDARPPAFESAVAALISVTDHGKVDHGTAESLATAMKAYQSTEARYYSVGAVRLHVLAATDADKELAALSAELADVLAEHEGGLDEGSFGATVAPAIIHFYAGEVDRRADRPADALGSYETVLSVYPYNEWPDAAAVRAAQCFATLGDNDTAIAKLQEVINAKANAKASETWQSKARQLLTELKKGA